MFANAGFTTKISSRERYSLLFINIITYLAYGIIGGSFGVAFDTLQENFKFETQQMAAGLSMQAIGGCVSAALATFTLDRYNRQVQFSFVALFLGIITLGIPFAKYFLLYLGINLALGFFCTLIDCISNAWVVELFRPEEHVFIQLLHFFYSFGTIISPFLLGPFLMKKQENDIEQDLANMFNETTTVSAIDLSNEMSNNSSNINSNDNVATGTLKSIYFWISAQTPGSDIWIPLVILGACMLTCAAIHFIAYFIKPYVEVDRKRKISKWTINHQDLNNNMHHNNFIEKSSNNLIPIAESGHDKKSKNLSKGYYVFFVSMIVVIVTFEVCNEVNAINFLPKVLKASNLDLDDEAAAYVFSILQFVITIARFANIFLSFKFNTVANIYFNFAVMVSGCIMLMIYISNNLLMVKIGIALLGLGYSTTYPLLISFVEHRITLTNKISSIMAFSSVFGLCVSPFIIGHFLDQNPTSFIYISFVLALVSALSFSFLYIMEVLRIRKL